MATSVTRPWQSLAARRQRRRAVRHGYASGWPTRSRYRPHEREGGQLGHSGDDVVANAIEEIQLMMMSTATMRSSRRCRRWLRQRTCGIPVMAGLSGRQIFSRTINVTVINPRLIRWRAEARQQIPGDFDEVRWGYRRAASWMVPTTRRCSPPSRRYRRPGRQVCPGGIQLAGISVARDMAAYNFITDQPFDDDSRLSCSMLALKTLTWLSIRARVCGCVRSVSGNDVTAPS